MKSLLIILVIISIELFFTGCEDPVTSTPTPRDEPWKVFTDENSPLENDAVNSIVIGGLGERWIATDAGAYKYASKSWEKIKSQLEYQTAFGTSSKVNCIATGRDGTVWFGMAGGGIKRMMRGYSGSVGWIDEFC